MTITIIEKNIPPKYRFKLIYKLETVTTNWKTPTKIFRKIEKTKKIHVRRVVNALTIWFDSHQKHPYPNEIEKKKLAKSIGKTVLYVNEWFSKQRSRYWK